MQQPPCVMCLRRCDGCVCHRLWVRTPTDGTQHVSRSGTEDTQRVRGHRRAGVDLLHTPTHTLSHRASVSVCRVTEDVERETDGMAFCMVHTRAVCALFCVCLVCHSVRVCLCAQTARNAPVCVPCVYGYNVEQRTFSVTLQPVCVSSTRKL